MCTVSRRGFLAASAAFLTAAAEEELLDSARRQPAAPREFEELAPGVFFYQADLDKTSFCNSGWVVFDDYVLVIDANYPAGARELIRMIRGVTDKPIRFAFDTHHHGDHAYGNQVFVEHGAVPVAHTAVLDEMKRLETGQFGGPPGRWESEAGQREDVRASRLKPPTLLFPNQLFFDDGKRRVELVHFGTGHTKGDAFAWLPNERILFSGDACVNGPYNFMGDGHVGEWIRTLDAPLKLGARTLCPGHGPKGTATVIEDQQAFFRRMVELVERRLAPLAAAEARAALESLRTELRADPRIGRYVATPGAGWDPFASQVEKVYEEVTGRTLAEHDEIRRRASLAHARAHGHLPQLKLKTED